MDTERFSLTSHFVSKVYFGQEKKRHSNKFLVDLRYDERDRG